MKATKWPILKKHTWRRFLDGTLWTTETYPHSGPQCTTCYETFCSFCNEDRYQSVLKGTDKEDCYQWHGCIKPPLENVPSLIQGATWTCPNLDCRRTYEIVAYWHETTNFSKETV